MSRRLVLVGNSHVNALRLASEEFSDELPTRFDGIAGLVVQAAPNETTTFWSTTSDGVTMAAAEAREKLERRTGRSWFDARDVWGVCMGLHTVALLRAPFWRSHAPSHLAEFPTLPASPRLVGEIVDAAQERVHAFLLELQRHKVPAFVVSTPPLRHDHRFRDVLAPDVVAHIDTLARATMQRFCDEHGIGYVAPPAQTRDSAGFFLRPDLRKMTPSMGREDLHHANTEYGKLMMRAVVDHAESAWLAE